MDPQKKQLIEAGSKVPREVFMNFLRKFLAKNSEYMKSHPPPGMTPISTMANLFTCVLHCFDQVMEQPISEFPFWGFFLQQSTLYDQAFN